MPEREEFLEKLERGNKAMTYHLTDSLQSLVHDSAIIDGHLSAFVVGSTGSITTIEHEPGVVQDLKDALNRLAPPGIRYAHEEAWHDGNGSQSCPSRNAWAITEHPDTFWAAAPGNLATGCRCQP